MPCFKHPDYNEHPAVPAGTVVWLDSEPAGPNAPVVAYIWGPSHGACGSHNDPSDGDITMTHTGTLARSMPGFVSSTVCRASDGGDREILYSMAVSGADVRDVHLLDGPISV